MVEIKKYHLPPTRLIPNSPQPLLHYKGILAEVDRRPETLHKLFDENAWKTQWIFRYGPTQESHYHSQVHECMAVLSGTATIRFGVADLSDDLDESTWGGAKEEGAVELLAKAGDVFIIPAGVAHKTYDTSPGAPFALLTPGKGRGIEADNPRAALSELELSGFTMMGAYPKNCSNWDFSVGGEDAGNFQAIWSVARPEADPILGDSQGGLVVHWKQTALSARKSARSKI